MAKLKTLVIVDQLEKRYAFLSQLLYTLSISLNIAMISSVGIVRMFTSLIEKVGFSSNILVTNNPMAASLDS